MARRCGRRKPAHSHMRDSPPVTDALSRVLPAAGVAHRTGQHPSQQHLPSRSPPSLRLTSVLPGCPPNRVGSELDSTTLFLRAKNVLPSNSTSPPPPPIRMPPPPSFRCALPQTPCATRPSPMTGDAYIAPPYPYGRLAIRRSPATSSIRTLPRLTLMLSRAARPPNISTRRTSGSRTQI